MRFISNIKSKVILLIHEQKNEIQFGSSCLFIKLDNEVGFKLYENRLTRNIAFTNQIKLYKLKMAPVAIQRFQISLSDINNIHRTIKRKTYYGYVTQCAKKITRKDFDSVLKFLQRMEEIGYETWDLENHWNLGKINKRIVCIDTDAKTLIKKD